MPSGIRLTKSRISFLRSLIIGMGIFLVIFTGACGKKETTAPPPPVPVEVIEVVQKDVPIYSEWVASLDGMVNATIRAQVQGYLVQQLYKEGDVVKKGQVLFQIDPRTFQAALDQAKADLARNEARWTQTKANLARVRPLAARNAVSQKDLDDAIAAEESGQASTEAAKATVDKAQLNLEFTRITSPIDGVSGIAKAQIGNLVGPGATEELTTVSTVNPIKAYISVSEQEYMQAQGDRTKGTGKRPLELILADGSTWPHKGEFFVADRQVDVRTGTIRVAATFANPENILRPGQFARVRARMALKKDALLIPQRAVSETQGKYLVAVVGPENKIAIKQVKAGERYGQLWVIEEGLTAGDKVVAEGIQKVRDGLAITPKPFETQPGAKPEAGAPAPAKPDASRKAGPKPEAQHAPKKR
jgi:membrane fusion protein, multidrug efflux system